MPRSSASMPTFSGATWAAPSFIFDAASVPKPRLVMSVSSSAK